MVANLEDQLTKAVANARRQPMDLPLAQVPLGRVHVISERCKQCDFCITYCPTDVLIYSDDINAKGYHYPVVAEGKEASCVHCRFCDLICPELAIYTTEVSDEDESSGEADAG
jgi:formate hydrogenlyase subunit 6/NADH:ubiquinone oxidoreductase subunit I